MSIHCCTVCATESGKSLSRASHSLNNRISTILMTWDRSNSNFGGYFLFGSHRSPFFNNAVSPRSGMKQLLDGLQGRLASESRTQPCAAAGTGIHRPAGWPREAGLRNQGHPRPGLRTLETGPQQVRQENPLLPHPRHHHFLTVLQQPALPAHADRQSAPAQRTGTLITGPAALAGSRPPRWFFKPGPQTNVESKFQN